MKLGFCYNVSVAIAVATFSFFFKTLGYHLRSPFFIYIVQVICRGDDMQTLEIKRDVEMPTPRVVFAYPYEDMEVGDSFVVPIEYRAKVYNANYRAGKRLGYKFQSKANGDVLHVWRVS